MTREEAIKELKIIREDYWDEYGDTMPALDMAIKALEEEPITDVDSNVLHKISEFFSNWDGDEDAKMEISVDDMREIAFIFRKQAYLKHQLKEIKQQPEDAPPVQPKPRVGHWIYDKRIENWKCSECGRTPKTIGYVGRVEFMREHFKFCNHCGAKMIEPQESEDKE